MSRFRPGVLPDYRSRTAPGEEIARAFEGYESGRDRQLQREVMQEERDYLRGQRARQGVEQDLAFEDMLRERGLQEVMPRDIEAAQRTVQRPVELPSGGDLFRPTRIAPDQQLTGGFGPMRPELEPGDIRDAFRAQAQVSPDQADQPVLLPGQFRPGAGFSPRAVLMRDMPDFSAQAVQQRMAEPSRLRAGGREFAQVGPTMDDRRRAEAQQIMRELIEAGVPENVATVAMRDPILARQFIRPEAEQEEGIPVEELEAAGIAPELARIASRDPVLARQILSAREAARLRPEPAPAAGAGRRVSVEQLVNVGIDPAVAEVAVNDQVLARQLITDITRGPTAATAERLPERTRERRSSIVSTLQTAGSRITEPWHQDIIDMLAGVDAQGRESAPLTADQIVEGYRAAGTPEDQLRRIQAFLRPMTFRR
jgi:hypothetical protein